VLTAFAAATIGAWANLGTTTFTYIYLYRRHCVPEVAAAQLSITEVDGEIQDFYSLYI
jgi:hypothetical protein